MTFTEFSFGNLCTVSAHIRIVLYAAYRFGDGVASVQNVFSARPELGTVIRVDQINDESGIVELRLADVVSGRIGVRCGAEVIVVDLHIPPIPRHRLKADPVRTQDASVVSTRKPGLQAT